jgi:hypothetical protein
MNCKHLHGTRCTNQQAIPRFGLHPSATSCARCPHYRGFPRGVGDLVETVTRTLGIQKFWNTVTRRKAGCCACQKRREALNQAAPLRNPLK